MEIRSASPSSDDAEAIRAIYNVEVPARPSPSTSSPQPPRNSARGWRSTRGVYPLLVAVDDGEVIGFASLSPYRPRPALLDDRRGLRLRRGRPPGRGRRQGAARRDRRSSPRAHGFHSVIGADRRRPRGVDRAPPLVRLRGSSASSARSGGSSAAGSTSRDAAAALAAVRAPPTEAVAAQRAGASSGSRRRARAKRRTRDGREGAARPRRRAPGWRSRSRRRATRPPGRPRKQAMPEQMTRTAARTRPSAIGARKTKPQDDVPGLDDRAEHTIASRLQPSARSAPIRSERSRSRSAMRPGEHERRAPGHGEQDVGVVRRGRPGRRACRREPDRRRRVEPGAHGVRVGEPGDPAPAESGRARRATPSSRARGAARSPTGRSRSRRRPSCPEPLPADVHRTDEGWDLDRRGECAQHDADDRSARSGQGVAEHEQPEHQRVVVGRRRRGGEARAG